MRLILWSLCICMAVLSTGCSSVTLYPLDGEHIIDMNKGDKFTAPRDGYFLSNEYFEKVLKAKVKQF